MCYVHARMRFLLGEVARQSQIRYPHVAVLVEEYVRGLEVTVNDIPAVHVLQTEDHLRGVELHLRLVENSVLT